MSSPTESTYFRHNTEREIVTVRISRPRITDEDNVEQFGESLVDLVETGGARKVLLDASELEYVTSSVLGKLIHVHRKLERDSGRMVMFGVMPSLYEILDATRLTTLFHIAEDEPAARKLLEAL